MSLFCQQRIIEVNQSLFHPPFLKLNVNSNTTHQNLFNCYTLKHSPISQKPTTATTKAAKMEDSTPSLEGGSMHVTLTPDQLLAFTRHIQSTNTGGPPEEFVREFVQRLHTVQMQTFSQVMQEFQLRQKPSAPLGLAKMSRGKDASMIPMLELRKRTIDGRILSLLSM
jgi:hypothetical protein